MATKAAPCIPILSHIHPWYLQEEMAEYQRHQQPLHLARYKMKVAIVFVVLEPAGTDARYIEEHGHAELHTITIERGGPLCKRFIRIGQLVHFLNVVYTVRNSHHMYADSSGPIDPV